MGKCPTCGHKFTVTIPNQSQASAIWTRPTSLPPDFESRPTPSRFDEYITRASPLAKKVLKAFAFLATVAGALLVLLVLFADAFSSETKGSKKSSKRKNYGLAHLGNKRASSQLKDLSLLQLLGRTVSTLTDGIVSDPNGTNDLQSTEARKRKRWGVKVRRTVWKKCNRRCYYCNLALADWRGENMHLDHKKAFSLGGADSESNLVASCPDCNLEKSAQDFPELN